MVIHLIISKNRGNLLCMCYVCTFLSSKRSTGVANFFMRRVSAVLKVTKSFHCLICIIGHVQNGCCRTKCIMWKRLRVKKASQIYLNLHKLSSKIIIVIQKQNKLLSGNTEINNVRIFFITKPYTTSSDHKIHKVPLFMLHTL